MIVCEFLDGKLPAWRINEGIYICEGKTLEKRDERLDVTTRLPGVSGHVTLWLSYTATPTLALFLLLLRPFSFCLPPQHPPVSHCEGFASRASNVCPSDSPLTPPATGETKICSQFVSALNILWSRYKPSSFFRISSPWRCDFRFDIYLPRYRSEFRAIPILH